MPASSPHLYRCVPAAEAALGPVEDYPYPYSLPPPTPTPNVCLLRKQASGL